MKKIIQILNIIIVIYIYYELILTLNNNNTFNPQWWILFLVNSIFFENTIKNLNQE